MAVVEANLVLAFVFGIVFGVIAQRMSFCLSTDLAQAFAGNYRRILTWFAIIFIITGLGFQFLGLKAVGQLRGYGVYNILSGIFFGLGIMISGGCVIGTLRRIGEGFLHAIVVFLAWLPGAALTIYFLNEVLKPTYHIPTKTPLLGDLLGVDNMIVYGVLAIILAIVLYWSNKKR